MARALTLGAMEKVAQAAMDSPMQRELQIAEASQVGRLQLPVA